MKDARFIITFTVWMAFITFLMLQFSAWFFLLVFLTDYMVDQHG